MTKTAGMINRLFFGLLAAVIFSTGSVMPVRGQVDVAATTEMMPTPGILRNSVTNLFARDNTLWAGPFLSLTTDGGASWRVPLADSLFGTRNSVYSIDGSGEVMIVGLGFMSRRQDLPQPVPSAGGFLVSTDGGQSFAYRFPQLDAPADTVIQYGASQLSAYAIVVPEQSPPYDVAFDPVRTTMWSAGWASGIRRSDDMGRTWRRVVLPPDDLDEVTPDGTYTFVLQPRLGTRGNFNHMGFAVHVDTEGIVWAGTPLGINRSEDGGVSWRRFGHDGTPLSLTGSWVTAIGEQIRPGERSAIWLASWNAAEAGERGRNGVTVTRDGGATWEQTLIGEQVYDFAFDGTTVYVAGVSGLHISKDDGATWVTLRRFPHDGPPDRVIRPDVRAFAAAATSDAVWVGTSDGLLRSTDGGTSWSLFRTEVTLQPETPTAAVPRVETYAYPNPFSPAINPFIRIRYGQSAAGSAEIRIFDFAMNLVRDLDPAMLPAGEREVTWDGLDDRGLRVANGTYFYSVKTSEGTAWGKILVLE
jgi:hypothetical protein